MEKVSSPKKSIRESLQQFERRHRLHPNFLSDKLLPLYFSEIQNNGRSNLNPEEYETRVNFARLLGLWFGPLLLDESENIARIAHGMKQFADRSNYAEEMCRFHFMDEYVTFNEKRQPSSLNSPFLWVIGPKMGKRKFPEFESKFLVAKFQPLTTLWKSPQTVRQIMGSVVHEAYLTPFELAQKRLKPPSKSLFTLGEFTMDTMIGMYFAHIMEEHKFQSPHVALTFEAFAAPSFHRSKNSIFEIDWDEPPQLYQISEYMEGGTLYRYATNEPATSTKAQYFAFLWEAMATVEEYSGTHGFFHKDPHAGNLVLRPVSPESPYYNAAWIYIRPRRHPYNEHDLFVIPPSVHRNTMIDLIDFGKSGFIHQARAGVAMPDKLRARADELLRYDLSVILGGAHPEYLDRYLAFMDIKQVEYQEKADIKRESTRLRKDTSLSPDDWPIFSLFRNSVFCAGRLKDVTAEQLEKMAGPPGTKLVLVSKWSFEENHPAAEVAAEEDDPTQSPQETVNAWMEKPLEFLMALIHTPALLTRILDEPELLIRLRDDPNFMALIDEAGVSDSLFTRHPEKFLKFKKRWNERTTEEDEVRRIYQDAGLTAEEKVREWMRHIKNLPLIFGGDPEWWTTMLKDPKLRAAWEQNYVWSSSMLHLHSYPGKIKRAVLVCLKIWDARHGAAAEEDDESTEELIYPSPKKQKLTCHFCEGRLARFVTAQLQQYFCDSACQLLFYHQDKISSFSALKLKASLL